MFLNCHSYFSLNYGIMSVEELLQHAESIGVRYMALTDINNTSGCLDFMRLASKYKISPSIGIDFRRSTEQLYIGIANNLEGFRELNEFLSIYTMKHEPVPLQPPYLSNCTIIYPWKRESKFALRPNEWIGLRPSDAITFRLYGKNIDRKKLLMLPTASFRTTKDFNTHRLLRAIFHNELLSKLPKKEQGNEEDKFPPLSELMKCYEEYPEAIQNTQHILKRNPIDFEFGKPKTKNASPVVTMKM
jgi:DNA polymerase III alpha subunit